MKGGLTSIYVSRNLPVCLGLAGLGFLPPGLCVFGGGGQRPTIRYGVFPSQCLRGLVILEVLCVRAFRKDELPFWGVFRGSLFHWSCPHCSAWCGPPGSRCTHELTSQDSLDSWGSGGGAVSWLAAGIWPRSRGRQALSHCLPGWLLWGAAERRSGYGEEILPLPLYLVILAEPAPLTARGAGKILGFRMRWRGFKARLPCFSPPGKLGCFIFYFIFFQSKQTFFWVMRIAIRETQIEVEI